MVEATNMGGTCCTAVGRQQRLESGFHRVACLLVLAGLAFSSFVAGSPAELNQQSSHADTSPSSTVQPAQEDDDAEDIYDEAYRISVEMAGETLDGSADKFIGLKVSGGGICDGVAADVAADRQYTGWEQEQFLNGCIDGFRSITG